MLEMVSVWKSQILKMYYWEHMKSSSTCKQVRFHWSIRELNQFQQQKRVGDERLKMQYWGLCGIKWFWFRREVEQASQAVQTMNERWPIDRNTNFQWSRMPVMFHTKGNQTNKNRWIYIVDESNNFFIKRLLRVPITSILWLKGKN